MRGSLKLVSAPDENAILDRPTQDELVTAYGALRAIDALVSAQHMVFDSIDGGGGLTGEFIAAAKALGSAGIGGVIVAWLNGRAGRKARLKIGDVEVEAQTPEQVEALLKAAKRYQDDRPTPRDGGEQA